MRYAGLSGTARGRIRQYRASGRMVAAGMAPAGAPTSSRAVRFADVPEQLYRYSRDLYGNVIAWEPLGPRFYGDLETQTGEIVGNYDVPTLRRMPEITLEQARAECPALIVAIHDHHGLTNAALTE